MLRVDQLRAGYGGLEVLHGLSFTVDPGSIVAVLGANGAGKSTLMRALAGMIKTSAGTIAFDDHPLEQVSADQRVRRGLALVPEGRALFGSLTVRENLIMGAYTRRSAAEQADDIARMLEYFPRLKQRLNAPAASLSGGEGQMLAISRALMAHPRLLLLDEPSQGLAPSIVDVVFDVITRLNADTGLTILLVEQNARQALTLAHHAYVLQGGTIALAGTPAELERNQSVHELYLGGHAPAIPSDTGGSSTMITPLLTGITARTVTTPRLATHILTRGDAAGTPVIFIHGNVSAARFFEETMLALPADYYAIAPDLRGFGRSATQPVDATRGLRDFADDLHSLITTLALTKTKAKGLGGLFGGNTTRQVHLVGWSMGSGVIMQYALDHPDVVASLTLISPLAPYGFGGTKDAEGTLTFADGAGSGGGTANPDFCALLTSGDRGSASPNSPRNVMNTFYFKPPFKVAPDREDVFVDEMLTTKMGDGNYPGDSTASANWPTRAPGKQGVNNAMAPLFYNVSGFADLPPRPPILWVRGADDQIVADASFFDLGTLGKLGFVPGWPGDAVFPAQPMVAQMRAVLDAYQAKGGTYQEVVLPACGHSPHIEQAAAFNTALAAFLRK